MGQHGRLAEVKESVGIKPRGRCHSHRFISVSLRVRRMIRLQVHIEKVGVSHMHYLRNSAVTRYSKYEYFS